MSDTKKTKKVTMKRSSFAALMKPKGKRKVAAQTAIAPMLALPPPKDVTYALIDKMSRSVMGEGRNKGLATAFTKYANGVFTTVMAITCCKDFLTDVTHAEFFNYAGNNHGFVTKKTGLFDEGEAFMVMSVLTNRGCTAPYPKMAEDIKALDTNWENIEKMLNWFEKEMAFEKQTMIEPFKAKIHRSKVVKIDGNMYGLFVPLFWCSKSYLISLHGLIVRAAMYWDGKGDPMAFLKGFKNEDTYIWTSAFPKIERMMKGEFPHQDLKTTPAPHHIGIQGFAFPSPKAAPAV